jgi:arylsulfatase A-like enzyme
MRRKNTRGQKIAVTVSLIVGIFFVSCYPLSTGAIKWRIKWDKALIASKKKFLSEKINDSIPRPNVILIVADDLGFNDVGCYGNSNIATPHIDQLAKEGVRCTEGYSTSPVCAPSRCGILTGRYQERCGFETQEMEFYPTNLIEFYTGRYLSQRDSNWVVATKPHYPREWEIAKQGVPPSEITLAELLKKYDYTTGIVGKWHLGMNARYNIPNKRGFDYQYGCYGAFTLYADKENEPGIVNYKKETFSTKYQWAMARKDLAVIYENNKAIRHERQYLTDAIRDRSIEFMEKNKDKPFFLYIPFTAPHEPYQAKQELYEEELAKGNSKSKAVYNAIVRSMDDAIGIIMQKLNQLGLDENTLVIFLSDNGPAMYTNVTTTAPLKGGKITQFEAGINVPFIIRWKDHLPQNEVYSQPIISLDIFTTVASIAHIELPNDRLYDGVNLMPYFTHQVKEVPHDKLFWRTGHIHTIRKGDYKLIFSSRDKWLELYNLKTDKSEKENLSKSMPDKVKELQEDLKKWESTLPIKPMWPRIMDLRFMIDGRQYLFPA